MSTSEEKTSIQQRLETMIQVFASGNKSAFGRKSGVQSGVLAGLIGGRMNNPSFSVLQKLLTSFPQIREEWLLLGKGVMLKTELDPVALLGCLASAKAALRKAHNFSNIEEVRTEVRHLRDIQARLKYLDPVYEAVKNNLYPDFDKKQLDDYEIVESNLITHTRAIIDLEVDLLKEGQGEADEYSSTSYYQSSPNKFIEIVNAAGHHVLVSINAISHIYSVELSGNAVVELTTSGKDGNKIIETSQPYLQVKELIMNK
jgi:hypothetical protein